MNPRVWGPTMWRLLFTLAHHLDDADAEAVAALREVLLELAQPLLPCKGCRRNYLVHRPRVDRRAHGTPRTREHARRWLWYLKDEVNRELRTESTPRADVEAAMDFSGMPVDAVAFADLLAVTALEARKTQREELFVRFCHLVGALLPADGAELAAALQCMRRPVAAQAAKLAAATRAAHGARVYPAAYYARVHAQ